MKEFIRQIPILGSLAVSLVRMFKAKRSVVETIQYWEDRYSTGGNSGSGSYGRLAIFKAQVINRFIKKNNIKTVIEFGCGDGHQLSLMEYPNYLGLDVSKAALKLCKKRFKNDKTKAFAFYTTLEVDNLETMELALSLDVIFHLIEDYVFDNYMRHLFDAANRFVIIYSSNIDGPRLNHMQVHNFTKWIDINAKDWVLQEEILNQYPYNPLDENNTSESNFYIYKKIDPSI